MRVRNPIKVILLLQELLEKTLNLLDINRYFKHEVKALIEILK